MLQKKGSVNVVLLANDASTVRINKITILSKGCLYNRRFICDQFTKAFIKPSQPLSGAANLT